MLSCEERVGHTCTWLDVAPHQLVEQNTFTLRCEQITLYSVIHTNFKHNTSDSMFQ